MKLEETQYEWEALKRSLTFIYNAILCEDVKIVDITDGSELGFTEKDGPIHMAREHSIMDGLTEGEKKAIRIGVFCHEMLHKVFTDFVYLYKILDETKNNRERKVLLLFSNLVEDPGIEHRAHEVVGGSMLKALSFTIFHTYKKSPDIEPNDKTFSQLVNALIQFGDMGIIKGEMSEEAYEYFKKIAPEMDAAIKDPVSKNRLDAARRWTKITEPLWKTDEDIEETCDDIMSKNNIEPMDGSGSGKDGESEIKDDEAHSKTLESLAEGKELPKDIVEPQESATLTASDIEYFTEMIYNELYDYEKEALNNSKPCEIPDIQMPEYSGTIAENIRVTSDDVEGYHKLKESVQKEINTLVRIIREIFRNAVAEEIRATQGRYNILRGIRNDTVKVFDKRKERNKVEDIAVMILVDESGSMRGNKIEHAKKSAVIISEAFSQLDIPCYIMGFTADDVDSDVSHYHYVTWTNLAKERFSLSNMSAKRNNFDGYSIRYAGRILSMHKAEKKLMFVISDGYPACRNYTSLQAGIEDATRAINDMSRHIPNIIGIGIGKEKDDTRFKKMYNGKFVKAAPETLVKELSRQLKRCILT